MNLDQDLVDAIDLICNRRYYSTRVEFIKDAIRRFVFET